MSESRDDHRLGAEYRYCRAEEGTQDPVSRRLAIVAVFAAAFLVAAVSFNRTVTAVYWHPYLGESDDKLARLRQLANDVTILFIGTSHVGFDVDPLVFDAVTGSAGVPTFSFNLGVRDMPAPEREHLLDSLASIPMPRLKYVFVEPLLNHTPDGNILLMARMRYHYDWRTVPTAVRVKFDSNRPLVVRLAAIAFILRQFAVSNANLGVLSDILLPSAEPSPSASSEIVRGYIGDTVPPEHLSSAKFKAQWDAGGGKYFSDPPWRDSTREMTVTELEAIRALFDSIQRLGARPVAFIPPQHRFEDEQVTTLRRALREHFSDSPLLAYNYQGPDELYENPDWWIDGNHLTEAGSHYFTVRLANDWLKWLSANPGR